MHNLDRGGAFCFGTRNVEMIPASLTKFMKMQNPVFRIILTVYIVWCFEVIIYFNFLLIHAGKE
jgi:hypothetical protein